MRGIDIALVIGLVSTITFMIGLAIGINSSKKEIIRLERELSARQIKDDVKYGRF